MRLIKSLALMISGMGFSSLVSAHEDHFLGDGMGHSFFHLLFIALVVSVGIKAVNYFRQRKNLNQDKQSDNLRG
ncbi:hypothetical protein [Neptunicella sp.]|uniref:hypothetical protein n=1 Tax=Neptunicella sp. TaxID=2125986 RepID=UPI003F693302